MLSEKEALTNYIYARVRSLEAYNVAIEWGQYGLQLAKERPLFDRQHGILYGVDQENQKLRDAIAEEEEWQRQGKLWLDRAQALQPEIDFNEYDAEIKKRIHKLNQLKRHGALTPRHKQDLDIYIQLNNRLTPEGWNMAFKYG